VTKTERFTLYGVIAGMIDFARSTEPPEGLSAQEAVVELAQAYEDMVRLTVPKWAAWRDRQQAEKR